MSRRAPCSPWRAAQAPGTVAPSFPGFGRWVTLAAPATVCFSLGAELGHLGLDSAAAPTPPGSSNF